MPCASYVAFETGSLVEHTDASSGFFRFFDLSVWTVEPAVITLVSCFPPSRPHGFSLALFGWLGHSGLTLLGGKGCGGMELAEKHLRFLPV